MFGAVFFRLASLSEVEPVGVLVLVLLFLFCVNCGSPKEAVLKVITICLVSPTTLQFKVSSIVLLKLGTGVSSNRSLAPTLLGRF
jgi:hypothetical protein